MNKIVHYIGLDVHKDLRLAHQRELATCLYVAAIFRLCSERR